MPDKDRTTHPALVTDYSKGDRVIWHRNGRIVAMFLRSNGDGTATLLVDGKKERADERAFHYEPGEATIQSRAEQLKEYNNAKMLDPHEINSQVGKYVPGIREVNIRQLLGA